MTLTVAESFVLQGTKSATSTSNEWTRLTNGGSLDQYIEFLNAGIVDDYQAGQSASYQLPIGSPLHVSDYPLPPPAPPVTVIGAPIRINPTLISSPAPAKGPAPTTVEVAHPIPTDLSQYLGADGTVLAPTFDADKRLTGLTGKSSSGDTYALTLSIGTTVEATLPSPAWVYASVAMTKNSGQPLTVSLSFAPLHCSFYAVISAGNVEAGVNLNGLVPAAVAQAITYYGAGYGDQSAMFDSTGPLPSIYIPASSAFWPYTDIANFFAPALAKIVGTTVGALIANPFAQWVSLNPSLALTQTKAQFVTSVGALIGPALGPIAASWLTAESSGIQGMSDAALWLGWMLSTGSGNADFGQAIGAWWEYIQALPKQSGPGAEAPILYVKLTHPVSSIPVTSVDGEKL